MAGADPKQDKAKRLSELAGEYRLGDIYVFGSRAAEIAAMIKNGRSMKRASSADVDIGVRDIENKRGEEILYYNCPWE